MVTSLPFLVALLASAAIYWTLPWPSARAGALLLLSLAIITGFDSTAGVLVVALTIWAWACARGIARGGRSGKVIHRLGVLGLIAALVLWKYGGRWLPVPIVPAMIPGLERGLAAGDILLPLGLSYFTFKYISYLTDVYWGVVRAGKLVQVATYGSLFTMFAAGPIERFERILPQLEERPPRIDRTDLEYAARRIAQGLCKKMVVADWIGYYVDPVWAAPQEHSFLVNTLALLGYSIQIYMDFAAYSDIAVGASRLFGFRIMENFDTPYFQSDIGRFWRHWHISLSDWIRDYVFFPLSGLRTSRFWNLVLVPIAAMVLCGLWHGVSWNFLLWGLWHGAGISAFQIWSGRHRTQPRRGIGSAPRGRRFVGWLITFVFVTVGWIWFRMTIPF